jgi:hypothetical protein
MTDTIGETSKDAARAHAISFGARISGLSMKWWLSALESAKWNGMVDGKTTTTTTTTTTRVTAATTTTMNRGEETCRGSEK